MRNVRMMIGGAILLLVGVWGQGCLRPKNNLAAWDTRIQIPIDTVVLLRVVLDEAREYVSVQRGETLAMAQSGDTVNVPLPPPFSIYLTKGWPDQLDRDRTRLHSRVVGVRALGYARIQGAQNQDASITGRLRVVFVNGEVLDTTIAVTVPAGQTQEVVLLREFDVPIAPYDFFFTVESNVNPLDPAFADTVYGELEIPLALHYRGDTVVTTLQRVDIPENVSTAADTTTTQTPNVEILRGRLNVVVVNQTPLAAQMKVWLYDASGTQEVLVIDDTLHPGALDDRGFVQAPAYDTLEVELTPQLLQDYIAQDSLYFVAEVILPALDDTVYASVNDQMVLSGFLEFELRVDPDPEAP